MIQSPFLLAFVLLAIEAGVLYCSKHKSSRKYFQFLPAVFWIYFLPMLASTAGLIDAKSPVYRTVTLNFLPASLFLLLMVVDIKAILRLGKKALLMFFAGSFGIMLGTVLVFALAKGLVGEEFWSGFGALSASWSGGSANMVAVKEAIGTPDDIFLPMVVVDTIVPYVWMGVLVAMVGFQPKFDIWCRSDRRVLSELGMKIRKNDQPQKNFDVKIILVLFAIAFSGSFLAQWLAEFFPVVPNVISTYAWTIIIVSGLGIAASFSPLRNLEIYGAGNAGYFLLYFVLTTIGAKASLAQLGTSFILIIAGFLIVLVHFAVLIAAARVLKAPMFLVASACQANIGGVASAPVIAEIYHPGLASVGLLLAIAGNIVGTYFGLLTARICYWVTTIL